MFKSLSLEEKIRIKTKIHQILIFLIGFVSIFAIYKIEFLKSDPFLWYIFIIFLVILSIISSEILKKWIYNTLSNYICNAVFHASSASSEIIKETNIQENVINKQIKYLKDCLYGIEKLKKLSIKAKESTLHVAGKFQESFEISENEQKSVEFNIEKMCTLKQKIEIIAELILELSEHTQQIESIIGVVEDINEQTNMLALNAAVEAARAGEHGKGFAVVASEIRKMADESRQATTKMSSLIYDIQQVTNSTVMATEEGSKEIESGVNLTRQTVQNIEKLGVTIQETVRSIDQIVKDSDDQIECTSEVYNIVGQLDIGLVESAEKIKQNLLILNDLLETSETIKDKIIGIDYNHKNKKCYKF